MRGKRVTHPLHAARPRLAGGAPLIDKHRHAVARAKGGGLGQLGGQEALVDRDHLPTASRTGRLLADVVEVVHVAAGQRAGVEPACIRGGVSLEWLLKRF